MTTAPVPGSPTRRGVLVGVAVALLPGIVMVARAVGVRATAATTAVVALGGLVGAALLTVL